MRIVSYSCTALSPSENRDIQRTRSFRKTVIENQNRACISDLLYVVWLATIRPAYPIEYLYTFEVTQCIPYLIIYRISDSGFDQGMS